jgi:hypothetical protein
MSERPQYQESLPEELEVRRDALLLRIVELRYLIGFTTLEPEIVSRELNELDTSVQNVKGLLDIKIFEEIFDTFEKIADSKKK